MLDIIFNHLILFQILHGITFDQFYLLLRCNFIAASLIIQICIIVCV